MGRKKTTGPPRDPVAAAVRVAKMATGQIPYEGPPRVRTTYIVSAEKRSDVVYLEDEQAESEEADSDPEASPGRFRREVERPNRGGLAEHHHVVAPSGGESRRDVPRPARKGRRGQTGSG